jgi:hypothetical protein
MGRFDALTELDEKPQPGQPLESPHVAPTPPPAVVTPLLTPHQPDTGKKQRPPSKKPATHQTGKSINAVQLKQDKFDKYSTYLRPGYKKELKLLAAELDCKDYELIDEALTRYFATRKK